MSKIELSKTAKKMIESKLEAVTELLNLVGLEVDHHCEFVSVIKDKDTGKVVGILSDNNDIEWKDGE